MSVILEVVFSYRNQILRLRLCFQIIKNSFFLYSEDAIAYEV